MTVDNIAAASFAAAVVEIAVAAAAAVIDAKAAPSPYSTIVFVAAVAS